MRSKAQGRYDIGPEECNVKGRCGALNKNIKFRSKMRPGGLGAAASAIYIILDVLTMLRTREIAAAQPQYLLDAERDPYDLRPPLVENENKMRLRSLLENTRAPTAF